MPEDHRNDRQGPNPVMGAALAIGAGIGAAMSAAADNPVWIGVGAGVGVAIGAALQNRKGD